ncbi:uncharacterized protein LOC119165925 [Rhipicephalus microplus]|uniref:uncharacterized protein LOC119165925 n=1 Tax=Rhipicephalus microplus TaxID=6941 RepID=UPI003F6B1C53
MESPLHANIEITPPRLALPVHALPTCSFLSLRPLCVLFFLRQEDAFSLVRLFVLFLAWCIGKTEGPCNARCARRSSLNAGAGPGLKGQQTPSGVDRSTSSIFAHGRNCNFHTAKRTGESLYRMPAPPHLAVISTPHQVQGADHPE